MNRYMYILTWLFSHSVIFQFFAILHILLVMCESDWCLPTVNHFGTPGFLGSPDALEVGFEGLGLDGPGLESVPVEVDVSSLERLIQNIESYIMFSTTLMHEHVKVNEYVKEHMIPVMFNVITQIHVHV